MTEYHIILAYRYQLRSRVEKYTCKKGRYRHNFLELVSRGQIIPQLGPLRGFNLHLHMRVNSHSLSPWAHEPTNIKQSFDIQKASHLL